MFAPGTIIGGRYKLQEELAKGGMGSIWVARHEQLDVDVAVKFMDPDTVNSPVARARFEREAKALAQLQYPHIVHVNDFGFHEGAPFLVMELLPGESFEQRLQREVRLPVPAVADVLVQVAKGLRRAHELGLVHRDLKPGNIFIARHDDEEIVKILDFGIAKQVGKTADGGTMTGDLLGSPHYMSPEQIEDPAKIDHRTDLWALGVILYRALTGELPFQGATVGLVMSKVLGGTFEAASKIRPGLPEGIDSFFERALQRDKTKRFESAREMAEAFATLAGAEWQSTLAKTHRPSGSSWQAQRAAPVDRSDAAAFEEATEVAAPRLSVEAPEPPEQDQSAETSPLLGGPVHGRASLPALTPSSRRGRTLKLGIRPGDIPPPGAEPTQQLSGFGFEQKTARLDQPIENTGTLTNSPTSHPTGRAQPNEQGAHPAPWRGYQRDRQVLLAVIVAAMALVLITIIVTVALRQPMEPDSANPTPSSSASASTVSSAAPSSLPAPPHTSIPAPPESIQAPEPNPTSEPSSAPAPEPDLSAQPNPNRPSTPLPKGFVDLDAVMGRCNITINGESFGLTPVIKPISPGKKNVLCVWTKTSRASTQLIVQSGRTAVFRFKPPRRDGPSGR